MRLNAKLGLLIIVSSILGLIVFIVLSIIIGDLLSEGYSHQELNALGQQLSKEAEEDPDNPTHIIDLLERTVSEHPQLDLQWVTQEETILYATSGRTENYTFHEIASQFLHTPERYWMPDEDVTFVHAWGEAQDGQYFILQLPVEAMQASQVMVRVRDYSDLFILILPLLFFLLMPYIVSFLFVVRVNHRLRKLASAMNHMDAEKPLVTITDRSHDEIGQLTRHFNSMSERISDQVVQIQQFERSKKTLIANLSHDLRTPMTKIQGYAETLSEELHEATKDNKEFVKIILRQSQYMEKLLQKLLEISNLDMRKESIELKPSNISEHLRKISADFVSVLENKKIQFDIVIPDQPVYALADSYLLERAIRNLIENAIHYGSSGHYLGVSLETTEDQVLIRIIDCGPGIPEEQIPFIFNRFYRGSAARQGEGMGIGLSIVQEIADMHDGEVTVQSVVNERTVFTLTLPRCDGTP